MRRHSGWRGARSKDALWVWGESAGSEEALCVGGWQGVIRRSG